MSLVFTQLATFQCCLSWPDTFNTITIPTRLVWLRLDNGRLGEGREVLPVMSVMSAGAGWSPSGPSGPSGVSGAEEV